MGDDIKDMVSGSANITTPLQKVLIADYDIPSGLSLRLETTVTDMDIRVSELPGDGRLLYQRISDVLPDLIVMNIALKHMDGLFIMEQLKLNGNRYAPAVYLLTDYMTDYVAQCIRSAKVDLIGVKPLDETVMLQNIVSLLRYARPYEAASEMAFEPLAHDPVKVFVQGLFGRLGISYGLSAMRACTAITLCVKDDSLRIKRWSKLYCAVAAMHNTTTRAVEHNMRLAIQSMVESNTPFYQSLFADIDRKNSKSFIDVITNYVHRHLGGQ